jgi:hypothetical protein
MTHLPFTLVSAVRTRPPIVLAGRFVLHFVEMVIAMQLGMLIFMPLASLVPATLEQVGMALFMAWPMVVWMRIRGHAWGHGAEMAIAMLAPWAVLVGLAATSVGNTVPWLDQAAALAMYAGMLGIMLIRRDHWLGGHEHLASSQRRHPIAWRTVFPAATSALLALLVPLVVVAVNFGDKSFGSVEPIQPPAFSGPLPAPAAPDPSKKIALIVSGPRGSEIGDTLESYEVLARSTSTRSRPSAPSYR